MLLSTTTLNCKLCKSVKTKNLYKTFSSCKECNCVFNENFSDTKKLSRDHYYETNSSLSTINNLMPGTYYIDVIDSRYKILILHGASHPDISAYKSAIEKNKNYTTKIFHINDFNGNLDSCIAIRTLVARNGKAYIQAGGGIVADSVPEREYQETINKAQALVRALELAANGLEE